jgi:dTDP-4-dehydrorhamnose reductase
MTSSRVLIIGASGQLGAALRSVFADRQLITPPRADFDLACNRARDLLDATLADVVINCAALHKLDDCESDLSRAFAINAIAVGDLAAACAEREIPFATISTDYVFDGTHRQPYTESDVTMPRTAYGISKLAGELLARRSGPKCIIIRSAGLFGAASSNKGMTLIERVLRQAKRGEQSAVVQDVVFSPSYVPHVARAIRALIDAEAFGTHHVTNDGECSWYDFVRYGLEQAGLPTTSLLPIEYRSVSNGIERPQYSAMRNTTFAGLGLPAMPSWRDAVCEYVRLRDAV